MEIEKTETEDGLKFTIYGSLSGKKDSTIALFETLAKEIATKVAAMCQS